MEKTANCWPMRNGGKPAERYLVKPSNAANDNLIETWQSRHDRDLSREDARQIVENVTGFFSILAEWSWVEPPDPANDKVNSDMSGSHGEVRHDR